MTNAVPSITSPRFSSILLTVSPNRYDLRVYPLGKNPALGAPHYTQKSEFAYPDELVMSDGHTRSVLGQAPWVEGLSRLVTNMARAGVNNFQNVRANLLKGLTSRSPFAPESDDTSNVLTYNGVRGLKATEMFEAVKADPRLTTLLQKGDFQPTASGAVLLTPPVGDNRFPKPAVTYPAVQSPPRHQSAKTIYTLAG